VLVEKVQGLGWRGYLAVVDTCPVDGSTVKDLTVTSDTLQDGNVLRATGRNVSYSNVAVLNGTSG
jgi:hypothetical protein